MGNNKTNQKINLVKKVLFYQVKSQNDKTNWKLRPFIKHIFALTIITLIIYVFSTLDYRANKTGQNLFIQNFKSLFKFQSKSSILTVDNLWKESFGQLYYTLKYALVGSFIGFIMAIITASGTNRAFNNKIYSFFSRNIILLLRAVPELIFIQIFTLAFRPSFSLFMIFMWFSWLWLHKYYIEAIENIDKTPYYVAISQGNSKFKAFNKEILPRLFNRFFSLFLYSFEANMRWAGILAALGAPGIGFLINFAGQKSYRFAQIGIPLFVLLIFIIVLEIFNILLNKYVFQIKTKTLTIKKYFSLWTYNDLSQKEEIYKKLAKKINFAKTFKILMLLLLSVYSIIVIAKTNVQRTAIGPTKAFFSSIFRPDWSIFSLKTMEASKNPFVMISQCLAFSVCSLTLTVLCVLLVMPFCSTKIVGTTNALIFRIINGIIRLVPSIVFIYLFNPILFNSYTLLIIVLGVHESSSMTKQLSEAMDNVDEEIIKNLKMQGYSRYKIYFKYILPTIKYDLISWIVFYFEMSFRSSITYSTFAKGQLELGSNISQYMRSTYYRPHVVMAYVWVGTLTILVINWFSEWINNRFIRNKKNNQWSYIKNLFKQKAQSKIA